MIDAVYAAALGLVIPILGISVCRRLWRHGSDAIRGRKRRDGGIFSLGFAVQASLLLVACYGFNRVASSMKVEPEPFDPYEILELPSRSSNATLIRSQYRRLSLKHHPDKNPGNKKASAEQFNRVTKAYKALSDPEARRNWKMYGHPDGHQPWTFDLAVPAWLRPGQDCSNETLALYALGYLAVLVGFVLSAKMGLHLLDPVGGSKRSVLQVTQEDVEALLNNLDETSSTEDVLECLAASPQLCSEDRRAVADEMKAAVKAIRERLVARGAGSLGAAPPAPSAPSKKSSRSGKSKRGGKSKGGGGADARPGPPEAGEKAEKEEGVVEGEFFSRGRRGEGNRRATRSRPEMSSVMTHNLVVLLSALYREGVVGRDVASMVADAQEGGDGGQVGAERDMVKAPKEEDDDDDDDDDDGAAGASAGGVGRSQGGEDEGSVGDSEGAAAYRKQLVGEHEFLFGLAEPLLDECLKVASRTASPRLFSTVVETKALLRRRLWSSEDPGALEEQRREADVDLDAAVPRVKVEEVVVETWGESQIAVGDTVTAKVTITREHASQYRGFRRRRPVDGFLPRGEPWWVILAAGKGGESLIAATRMLVENLASEKAECKMKFQAPRRSGIVHLTVMVKSPVFVGVDCEGSATMRVFRHEELKDDEDAGDW